MTMKQAQNRIEELGNVGIYAHIENWLDSDTIKYLVRNNDGFKGEPIEDGGGAWLIIHP